MKKVHKKNSVLDGRATRSKKGDKTLTIDDTINLLTNDNIPRRYRNPISLRWDDTTWV